MKSRLFLAFLSAATVLTLSNVSHSPFWISAAHADTDGRSSLFDSKFKFKKSHRVVPQIYTSRRKMLLRNDRKKQIHSGHSVKQKQKVVLSFITFHFLTVQQKLEVKKTHLGRRGQDVHTHHHKHLQQQLHLYQILYKDV